MNISIISLYIFVVKITSLLKPCILRAECTCILGDGADGLRGEAGITFGLHFEGDGDACAVLRGEVADDLFDVVLNVAVDARRIERGREEETPFFAGAGGDTAGTDDPYGDVPSATPPWAVSAEPSVMTACPLLPYGATVWSLPDAVASISA